jgi:hypothetical protein
LQPSAVDHHGFSQGSADARGSSCGFVLGCHLVEDDHELVTSHSEQDVLASNGATQTCGHGLEQTIAHLVAQSIVDELEAIQIQKDERHQGSGRLGGGKHVGQGRRHVVPIRQPGELIVVSHVIQASLVAQELLFGRSPLRHVARGVDPHFIPI